LAVAALLCAQAAAAHTLRYDGPMYAPYSGAFTINDNPPAPSISRTVSAGGFKMTDTSGPAPAAGTSFMAWCVDIYGTLTSSTAYTLKTGEQFYGVGSSNVTSLERLASYAFDHWTGADNVASAAFQLAVWEVVTESAKTYSLSSDNFTVTGGDMGTRNLADSWLAQVNAGTYAIDQTLGVWQKGAGSTTQNLAVFAPIPEPQTYTMLIAGLGLMAFVARRRRQNLAA
jgi:hypothetical protein